jgi:hypothetical protein
VEGGKRREAFEEKQLKKVELVKKIRAEKNKVKIVY